MVSPSPKSMTIPEGVSVVSEETARMVRASPATNMAADRMTLNLAAPIQIPSSVDRVLVRDEAPLVVGGLDRTHVSISISPLPGVPVVLCPVVEERLSVLCGSAVHLDTEHGINTVV